MPVRGFTLLEMLAATAMVAVLAGSLYVSLYVAFRAKRSALAGVESVRKASLALELIEADLRSAMVPNPSSNPSSNPNRFLAGAFLASSNQGVGGSAGDTLTFFAAAMDMEPCPGTSDVKKIEYSLEPSSDSREMLLMRRVTTNLLAPLTPEPRQEIVCRGLRAFVLRYFDGSAWQDNWDSTARGNVLPKAVEVTLEWDVVPAGAGSQASRVVLLPCGQDSAAASSTSGGSS